MSRLILKPALVLEGTDQATGYEVRYEQSSKTLEIGCESYSLAEWKKRGAEIITTHFSPQGVSGCECSSCTATRAARPKRNAAAIRKYLPRLERLIAHIERAEAALKQSQRAQTKQA